MLAGVLLSALVITVSPFGSQPALPSDPPSIRAGFDALRKGEIDSAIAAAEAEIKRHPSAAAQELLGAALIQQHQWDRAEEALKRAQNLDPKRLGPTVLLGQLLLHANRLPEAEERFKVALKLAPRDSTAQRGLAGVSLRRGNLAAAIATLGAGLTDSGGRDAETRTLLGTLYYELGQLSAVERVIGQPCVDASGCLLLGLTRLEQGRRGDALTLPDRAAKENPTSSWAAVARGVAAWLRGRSGQSVSELEAVAKRQPDWPFVHLQEGEAWLSAGEVPRASAAFGQAVRVAVDPAMTRARA